MQNSAIQCIFGQKIVRNVVHNAFLNILTVASLIPFVQAAFQQWDERRTHAFSLEMIRGSAIILD